MKLRCIRNKVIWQKKGILFNSKGELDLPFEVGEDYHLILVQINDWHSGAIGIHRKGNGTPYSKKSKWKWYTYKDCNLSNLLNCFAPLEDE